MLLGGGPLVNTGPESELTLNFKLTYLITKIFVCVYVCERGGGVGRTTYIHRTLQKINRNTNH